MQQSGTNNQADLSPGEAARILTECRNSFSAETTPIVDRLFAALDQLLEARILVELSGDERKAQLAAQLVVREKKNQIAMRFRDCFLAVFERTLAGRDTDAAQEGGGLSLELELVEDNVIEEDLVSRHVEWLITDACAAELHILDRRMPVITGSNSRHPLSPRCVMRALRDACLDPIPDAAMRLQLLNCIDNEAAQAFLPAYQSVSAYVAERVAEPRIKAVKNPQSARPAAGGGAPQTVAGGGTGIAGQTGQFNANQLSPTPLNAMPAQALSFVGAAQAAGTVAPVSHELLAKLDRLIERHQERHPDLVSAPPQINQSSGVSVDLESVLLRLATQPIDITASATHNLVRDIKSNAGDSTLPAAESIIIDVVAMMFDYIFDDSDISPQIKGVLGRLQMPVLKIALTDKTFFSNKHHPARQLVDRLAELASEYTQDSPEEKRLFEQFSSHADAIHAAPETSVQAFEAALKSLEEFAEPNDEGGKEAALRISRNVTQAEEAAQRKRSIRHSMAEKLAGHSVPMSVSRFVLNQWVDYLVLLKEKQADPARLKAVDDGLSDLLWSVSPKHSVGELALLTRRIPVVIEAVNACLDAVNVFPHERQQILESLRTAHLDNLKRDQAANAEGAAVVAAHAAKVAPPAPIAPEPEEEPPLPDLPEDLLKGALLDFTEDGKTIRARLNWISPSRRKFVFTSHAMPAFGLSADELADELEAKRAVIVKQGSPIMERIVEKAIKAVD